MISVPPDDMETEEDWQMKQIIAFGDSNTWGLNPALIYAVVMTTLCG